MLSEVVRVMIERMEYEKGITQPMEIEGSSFLAPSSFAMASTIPCSLKEGMSYEDHIPMHNLSSALKSYV